MGLVAVVAAVAHRLVAQEAQLAVAEVQGATREEDWYPWMVRQILALAAVEMDMGHISARQLAALALRPSATIDKGGHQYAICDYSRWRCGQCNLA